jgi:hypothetical protein
VLFIFPIEQFARNSSRVEVKVEVEASRGMFANIASKLAFRSIQYR